MIALLLLVSGPSTGTAIVLGAVGVVGSLALLLLAGVLGDRAARAVPIPAARPAGRTASCGGAAAAPAAARCCRAATRGGDRPVLISPWRGPKGLADRLLYLGNRI